MGVREELDNFLEFHGLSPMDRQKVQWFMADYAHELAEEIRNSMDHEPTYSSARKSAQVSQNVGRLLAANLIDTKGAGK